jgi:heptaprenyl diphosphate synthase
LYLRRLATTDAEAAALLARIEADIAEPAKANDLQGAIVELREHAVTRQTLDEAHRWSRDAVAALAPLPEGPVKKALTRFAETIVERSN